MDLPVTETSATVARPGKPHNRLRQPIFKSYPIVLRQNQEIVVSDVSVGIEVSQGIEPFLTQISII